MRLVVGTKAAGGKDVRGIQRKRQRNLNLRQHVSCKQCLFVTDLVIDSSGDLVIVFVKNVSRQISATRIECLWESRGNLKRSGTETRGIDFVVDEWRSQSDGPAILTGR